MKKVIFDTDIGNDDAIALISLLLNKNISVIGITTVHGNLPVEYSTDNALRLVDYFNMNIPVYKGCDKSLRSDLTSVRASRNNVQTCKKMRDGKEVLIHQKTLNIPEAKSKAQDIHAVDYIVDTLLNTKEKINICAVGPLTNIAEVINKNPQAIKNIDTLYIMGGGINKGNRTPYAEANFYDDPEAVEIVLNSGINIVLTPLEACFDAATFSIEDRKELKAINNKISDFAYDALDVYTENIKFLFNRDGDNCCIYDYAAVTPLIDENIVLESKACTCHCETSGVIEDGKLIIEEKQNSNSKVKIVYKLDRDKLKNILINEIKEHKQ